MIDIKRNNPGIALLGEIQKLTNFQIRNLCDDDAEMPLDDLLLKAIPIAVSTTKNRLAPLDGFFPLREKISVLIEKEYSYAYNPETEITITAGASNAVSTAISAFVKDGDEVIIFEPSFFTYSPLVLANGGRTVYIKLKLPDYHVDWDEVQKGITGNTRMIILNTPHNPTGSLLSAQDMERLSRIVNGTKIIILSDESFGKIVFEGYEHQSMARFPKLAERSLIISSFGKALQTEGWKIGYCLAPEKLSSDFRKFHHILSFSVSLPFQLAISEIISEKGIFENRAKELESKRDFLMKGLKNSKFKLIPSKGTYFQLLNYSEISEDKDVDFGRMLLETHKIAVMPLSYFYHDFLDLKCFRICFSKPEETLQYAVSILNSF